uniref:Uncharacterized protein n=1 Tax=Avena sativa TaxID=4498 RepID=A0ACD6A0L1_AVESA
MDTRRAALCSLLLLLILHASPTSAAAAADGGPEVCKYGVPLVPFCKDWSCKAGCWMEATLLRARVKEHRCIRGGIKGVCYCLFCGKHLALD